MNINICCTCFGLKIHGPSRKGVVPIKKLAIKPCLQRLSVVNTVGCWGPNKHQLGLLVKTWFGLFPWIESHKIELYLHPSHNDLTCRVDQIYIYIYFTQNKRHWLFSFPSKLSEAKREEAEVQKAMEELKRKATLEEWGIFDKNVALPNLSETKHLRGLFSFEIRPNNFMWLVTRQFACSIKLPKGYSSSEPWGQNAAKGSELSRIEKQSECIGIIPFFCSWGSTIVVLPNRYTL